MPFGEFKATLISSTPLDAALYPKEKAVDLVGAAPNIPDYSTMFIDGTGANGYIGWDMGAGGTASQVTQISLAARTESDAGKHNLGAQPWILQSSTDGSAWTQRAIYTAHKEFIGHLHRNVIDVSAEVGATTARYWRILFSGSPVGAGQCSDFALFGNAVAAALQPVAPTITPSGGRYPIATPAVTIRCLDNTGADISGYSIFYTLDDSNPTIDGGGNPTGVTQRYSGPIVITPTAGGVRIRAVGYAATFGTTLSNVTRSAPFFRQGIKPNEVMYNTSDGYRFLGRGGAVFRYGNYFYRVGFQNDRGQTGVDFYGSALVMYKGTDGINWQYVGQLCRTPNFDPTSLTGDALIRPHLYYNTSTAKWVLIAQWYTEGAATSQKIVFYTSNTLEPSTTGYTLSNPGGTLINGKTPGDQHFFTIGADGYVVWRQSGGNNNFWITKLNADWLGFSASETEIPLGGADREAPVFFILPNGKYVILNSQAGYYAGPFNLKYFLQTDGTTPLNATWAANTDAFASTPAVGTDYDAQPCDVIRWIDGSYIMYGDWWSATNGMDSKDVLLPITLTGDTIQIQKPAEWSPVELKALTPSFARTRPGRSPRVSRV